MTEIPLTPMPSSVNPDVLYVAMSGDGAVRFGDPNLGVFTIPAGVHSFSTAIYGGFSLEEAPRDGSLIALFSDVPCTPGDEWLLEGGDTVFILNPLLACLRNTYHGGDGAAGVTDAGMGGAGASALFRRRTSTEVFAVAGGLGGTYTHTGGSTYASAPGPSTLGGFADPAGGSNGADTAAVSGGGGGGWPGGAAGAATAPGETGGSYFPAAPGSSLGGPPSPPWDEFSSGPFPFEPSSQGSVFVWFYARASRWKVGHLGFPGAAW